MTRRMIDSSLWTNERFGEMPMMARLLLLGLINHADDQGRIKAHSIFLRTQIFPYDDVSVEEIEECLSIIEGNETILLYETNGKRYIQLVNWWEYQSLQFAAPSEYPRPDGWQDRVRYNAKGGSILTSNWRTPKGELSADTCDQDGNPICKPTAKSGDIPSGNPPVTPRGGTNKDQDQIQNKGGDHARATEPPRQSFPPPPSLLANEYIPGVKLPQPNQAKRNCDHYSAQAGKYGVGPEPFRMMVDAVLDATGKRKLADTNGDLGQQTLNQAKETVVTLLEMGRRAIEDIQAVLVSWRENDWRGGSTPSFAQIVEHASSMDSGTHITKRRQDSNKKEFASLADYNEWASRNDPEYKRIREGILVRGTTIKRSNYQPQPVH